jgi:hypothetical protein
VFKQRQSMSIAMHKSIPFLLLVLVSATACGGCFERRLLVRSNPPGALLKIDDEEIGVTPVSTSFVYYGTRKMQLIKDGYETLTILQPIPAPITQWPGVDFFTEHLVPRQIRDVRVVEYQLQPAAAAPADQVLERGKQLRRNAQAGAEVVPAPGSLPATPGPNTPGAWPLPAPQAPGAPLPWQGQPAGPPGPTLPAQPSPPGWQAPR